MPDPIFSFKKLLCVAGSQVPAPANITNPSPWQYDVASDRHYDSNHAHWHSGPPPANATSSSIGASSTSGSQVSAPANITNPSPWQYEAVTDRHYDPNHAHWHNGPPPTNPTSPPLGSSSSFGSQVSAPPNITNPSPWQYDAVTDRFYDPNHGHWHGGPPPADPITSPQGSSSTSGSQVPAPTNITNPSHAALMTGLSPRDTAVIDNITPIADRAHTLAEAFLGAEFATVAVLSTTHLRPEQSGLGQGSPGR